MCSWIGKFLLVLWGVVGTGCFVWSEAQRAPNVPQQVVTVAAIENPYWDRVIFDPTSLYDKE